MSNILFKLFTISVVIVLFGCATHEYNNSIITGYDNRKLENGEGLTIKEFHIVELELSSECVLSYPQKIDYKDSLILILDDNRLLVFNEKGKFLRRIGKRGHGKGEYINLSSYYIDDDKNIVIIEGYKNSLITYTTNGIFLKEDKLKNEKNAYIHYASNIGHDSVFINSKIMPCDDNAVYSFLNSREAYGNTFVKTHMRSNGGGEYIGKHSFSHYNGIIRYVMPFDNILFSVNGQNNIEIQTNEKMFDDDEKENINNFGINTYADALNKNIFVGFTDVFETAEHIFVACHNLEYTLIDKNNNTCRKYDYLNREKYSNLPLINIMSTNGDYLIGMLAPDYLKNTKEWNRKNKFLNMLMKYKNDTEGNYKILVYKL